MLVLNKILKKKTLSTERFSEMMEGYSSGKEIITSERIFDLSEIKIPDKSALIIELR